MQNDQSRSGRTGYQDRHKDENWMDGTVVPCLLTNLIHFLERDTSSQNFTFNLVSVAVTTKVISAGYYFSVVRTIQVSRCSTLGFVRTNLTRYAGRGFTKTTREANER